MTLTGLDISRYQWPTPPLANYEFVFIRATYGLATDSRYAAHMAAARAAGIVAGSYHFGYNSTVGTPAAQAKHYLDVAAASDLLVLDLESSGESMTLTEARAFIAEVHRHGRQIVLYHSESGFPDCGQDQNWVAAWDRTTFPLGATFWQYRGSPLDLDKFKGDAAALRALVAASHIPQEESVQSFTVDPVTLKTGTLTLNGPGHYYLRAADGIGHGPLDNQSPAWINRPAFGPVNLLAPWVGETEVYVVGTEAAYIRAVDCTFTPDGTDCADAVAAEHERTRQAALDAVGGI